MTASRSSDRFLGVDVGTSACKTVILDAAGRLLATRAAGYATRRTPTGEVTQEQGAWLRAVATTIRGCLAAAPGGRVEGLSITAPAHVGVLVDRHGDPLARSLLAFDGRPGDVAASLSASLDERCFDRTFVALTAGWTLPQLVWLRGELGPKAWRRVARVTLQKDFVRGSLTGDFSTDASDAAGTAMIDQRERRWIPELCDLAHLAPAQLPQIRPAFEIAGGVGRSWARRTGLTQGTPVAVGATDTPTELLSVAAHDPGSSIVKIASTGTIVTVTAEPRPHPGLLTYPHALDGRWYSAAATSSAATAYNWCSDLLGLDRTSYRGTEAAAARIPVGSDGLLFLPFLNGERTPYWDSRLRGAFLGLSSGHGRAHLVRAVMEGVCFSLRDCLELMGNEGIAIDTPCFTGGGTSSPLWRRILAATLGTAAELARPQGPAIGAALLARRAVTGADPEPRLRRTPVEAPPEWRRSYGELYEIYAEAAGRLADISHRLSDAARLRG